MRCPDYLTFCSKFLTLYYLILFKGKSSKYDVITSVSDKVGGGGVAVVVSLLLIGAMILIILKLSHDRVIIE